jgi:class 3 adenylate cyclase
MALMAAATHPERVDALVLINGFARLARADDYPAGMPPGIQDAALEMIRTTWGTGALGAFLAPSVADEPGFREFWGKLERFVGSPGVALAKMRTILELDVRRVLPLVSVPTLVVHSRDQQYIRVGHGRYLAEHIDQARLVELESADHTLVPTPELLGTIEEFMTGSRGRVEDADRVLATVLVVDIARSTERVSELGDRRWSVVRDHFESTARDTLVDYGGQFVDAAGDGLLAIFDGPARAVRCACHLRDATRLQGLEVRCGLHAGEVSRRQGGIAGIAVHIGARVAAHAEPGEVLVTRTIRDLVAGSGLVFDDRGEYELKGVPERWRLYASTG